MKCAFTICTLSYLGLAKVLKKSFMNYHNDFDFYIIFVDEKDDEKNSIIDYDILRCFLSESIITNMRFKYDVTEYCTSIKPFAFNYFLKKGYSKILYFDPDIKFYSIFKEVYDDSFEAYVTPHQLVELNENAEDEIGMLKHGLFNCGFIGFNNSIVSQEFINFWCDRLINYSFDDSERGIYTDQKWIDLIYIRLQNKVRIIKNPGCNYAPWNMNSRKVIYDDNIYYVNSIDNTKTYELVFMHFSGLNYNLLINGVIKHGSCKLQLYYELKNLLIEYGESLKTEYASNYFKNPYKFNYYSNGKIISKLNRRLYRVLNDKYSFKNPFDCNDDFYILMQKSKLINKNKLDAKINNTRNIDKKKKALLCLFKTIRIFLGINKYMEFLRAVHKYSTYEEQIFLVKEKGLFENGIKK